MFWFINKRIFQSIIVMLFIGMIGFSMQLYLGDPVRAIVGERVTSEERQALRTKLGLNDPFIVQYVRFIKNAFKGDFGNSFFYKKPVIDVILAKAPATIELVLVSSLIIVLICFPVGVFSAIYPKHWLVKIILSISTIGCAVPVFLTAIILIYIFGVELNWLPTFGRGQTVLIFGWESGILSLDGWKHLILPSVSLSSLMLPLFIRLIRSEMLEVLETEYIKFAWAKGLKTNRIWFVHALKNTMLPVITVFGIELGILFAFTLMTETIFQWHGIGFMFLESVERADTPLIVAYLVLVGCMFVIVNTIVDILYGYINPTVQLKAE